MATWYIALDHANNGNGDGSADQVGAGGAWNTLDVNNASIAAGDTVIIKTGNGVGGDAAFTTTGVLTFKGGSASGGAVTFIFDDGTVWAGDAGVFQLSHSLTTASRYVVFSTWCSVIGNDRLVIKATSGNSFTNDLYSVQMRGANIAGVEIRHDTADGCGSDTEGFLIWLDNDQNSLAVLRNCKLIKRVGAAPRGAISWTRYSPQTIELHDCKIELPSASAIGLWYTFAETSTVYARLRMYGGEVVTGNVGNKVLNNFSYLDARFQGVKCDNMDFFQFSNSWTSEPGLEDAIIEAVNCNGGVDCAVDTGWARIDSDQAGNYPYLQARDQQGNPWTMRVYPRHGNEAFPLRITSLYDYYTLTAATRTVKVALLMQEDYTNVDDARLWVDVEYVQDSDGATVRASTQATPAAAAAIASDTAGWSAVIYGALNYNKHKIELTTPTAIKANTVVKVTVWSALEAPGADKFFFIDPAPVIS